MDSPLKTSRLIEVEEKAANHYAQEFPSPIYYSLSFHDGGLDWHYS